MENNIFYFDDFFVSASDAVEIRPEVRGRVIPMTVRRKLTLQEREDIRNAATIIKIDPKTGEPVVTGVDQSRAVLMTLEKVMKEWPFKNKDGSPVPINSQTIAAIDPDVADAIFTEYSKLQDQKDAAREVFDNPSVAAS